MPRIDKATSEKIRAQYKKLRGKGLASSAAAKVLAKKFKVGATTALYHGDPKVAKWFKEWRRKYTKNKKADHAKGPRVAKRAGKRFKATNVVGMVRNDAAKAERFVAPNVEMIRVIVESNGSRNVFAVAGVKSNVVLDHVRAALSNATQ